MNNYLKSISIVFLIIIFGCIIILSWGDLNPKESGLMGIILTIFSIGISWIISHAYSENSHKQVIKDVKDEHQNNLRMFAIKAAEKVNNLSNELSRLALYLQQELEYNDYDGLPQTLLAREERIESTIHLINTLKSVNDTSLSDWEGIIGEELNRQREHKVEQVEEIRETVERLNLLLENKGNTTIKDNFSNQNEKLQVELASIDRDIKLLLATTVGTSWKNRNSFQSKKSLLQGNCPACKNEIKYKQRTRSGNVKAFNCPNCSCELKSIFNNDNNYFLTKREKISVEIICPSCTYKNKFKIDEITPTEVLCVNCNANLRIHKTLNDNAFKVKIIMHQKHVLTEDIIQQVKESLPPQPWIKDTHKSVAEELEISPQVVQKSIKELIKRGIVMDQVNGILCTPNEASKLRSQLNSTPVN